MTQPLGMSGEEEWWEDDKFYGQDHVPTCDIPAILKEHRRLVIEEARDGLGRIANSFGPVSEAHLHDEIERFREKVSDMLESL